MNSPLDHLTKGISQAYKEISLWRDDSLRSHKGCSGDGCLRELTGKCVNILITYVCQIIFAGKIVITVISTVSYRRQTISMQLGLLWVHSRGINLLEQKAVGDVTTHPKRSHSVVYFERHIMPSDRAKFFSKIKSFVKSSLSTENVTSVQAIYQFVPHN